MYKKVCQQGKAFFLVDGGKNLMDVFFSAISFVIMRRRSLILCAGSIWLVLCFYLLLIKLA